MEIDLTILIPCYNQAIKLEYCLQSLVNQSYKKFRIILIDDNSTICYNDVISKFPDLNITFIKNQFNLGAFNNILNCLSYKVDTKYKMVFHEDDVIHPEWLGMAMMLLVNDSEDISWIGCNMNFFENYDDIKFEKYSSVPDYNKNNINSLIDHIISGKSLSFCSIIYRSSIIESKIINLSDYSVLGDRVLLLELALNNGFIYVDSSLVHAFDHKEDYSRWASLKYKNLINYYKYIKSLILKSNFMDKHYKSKTTNSLLQNSLLVTKQNNFNRLLFYSYAYFSGLISLKYHLLFIWRNNKVYF